MYNCNSEILYTLSFSLTLFNGESVNVFIAIIELQVHFLRIRKLLPKRFKSPTKENIPGQNFWATLNI